jgi:hypothetical protein
MKTIKNILSLSIIALLVIGIWSCDGTDPDPNPVSKLPTLAINPPQALAFDVGKGEVVNFHIEANANANTNSDLTEVTLNVTYSAGGSWDTIWYVDATESKYKVIDYDFTVPVTANDEDVITIEVAATDKNAYVGTKTFVLTVKDLSGLSSHTAVLMGAHENADYGSFYATSTNTVFKVAEAAASGQSTIDFVYFYGTINTATIASPDNDDVFGNAAGKIGVLGVQNWTTRNATRFRKIASMTQADWDVLNATRVSQLYQTASQPEEKLANYLFDGSGGTQSTHVVFKTSKNKYGVFKVTEIDGFDKTGTITIDVKVEK